MIILAIIFIALALAALLPVPFLQFGDEESAKTLRGFFFIFFLLIGCILLVIAIVDAVI